MIESCNGSKYKSLNSNNFIPICICVRIHKTVRRKDYFLPTVHNLRQAIVAVFFEVDISRSSGQYVIRVE